LCRARESTRHPGHGESRAEYEVVLVARSDGVLAADVRPLVRMSVHVIAEENVARAGIVRGGGRTHYSHFTEEGC